MYKVYDNEAEGGELYGALGISMSAHCLTITFSCLDVLSRLVILVLVFI